MEWSRKEHVLVWWIKIALRAYSLVRCLCHDSKYRSLHSKPTLSHTSPFSSHRKDIRSRDSVCFFRRVSTPTQRPSFLPSFRPLHRLIHYLFRYLLHLLLCTPRAIHPHTLICFQYHILSKLGTLYDFTQQSNSTSLYHACSLKP